MTSNKFFITAFWVVFFLINNTEVFSAIIRMKSGEVLNAYIFEETDETILVRLDGHDRELQIEDIDEIDYSDFSQRYKTYTAAVQASKDFRADIKPTQTLRGGSYYADIEAKPIVPTAQTRRENERMITEVRQQTAEIAKINDSELDKRIVDFFNELGYNTDELSKSNSSKRTF